MLTFEFTGVEGRMTESEVLTSGMVGKTVRILFDSSWDSLTKTLVFRSGQICRTADGSASTVSIPEAVLSRPFCRLYVGVYGTDEDGTLVIPTVMAEGPMIRYGADPTEDPAGDNLPVWKNLQDQLGDLTELETDAKENLVAAVNELHSLLPQSDDGTGLSETAATLLIDILRHGVYDSNQAASIDALEVELTQSGEEPGGDETPEKPTAALTGLSVAYNGGDVPAGTALSKLTGIAVTAHYSDGSTQAVTDYILNGQIKEGENTVTATYRGMSVMFTVTGIPVAVTGITAVYSGGDVPVGTALTALKGLIVTAIYSDGTRTPVHGYTLSGQITEGANRITVSYLGKSASFTVTGIAQEEGGGEEQTETLELVYTSGYPNVTTFAYTERSTPGQYVVAKQGQLRGGILSVDYDPDVCNQWNLNLYVFDADGNPYCQTDSTHTDGQYHWGQTDLPGWEAVGAGAGFGFVYAPFSVALPAGCTAIACMRYASTSTGDGSISSNASFSQWAKEGGITFTVTASV